MKRFQEIFPQITQIDTDEIYNEIKDSPFLRILRHLRMKGFLSLFVHRLHRLTQMESADEEVLKAVCPQITQIDTDGIYNKTEVSLFLRALRHLRIE